MVNDRLIKYLFHWTVSFVIFETLFNAFAWTQTNYEKPSFPTLKRYYHDMPVPIVVWGDFFYSTMIFINAYAMHEWFYKFYYSNYTPPDILSSVNNIGVFLIIMVSVQVIYDVIYYLFVTYSGLDKRNDYVSFFKEYAKDYSYRAIYSDSIYLALWTALFYLIYHTTSYLWKYYILALGGFVMVMVSYEDI